MRSPVSDPPDGPALSRRAFLGGAVGLAAGAVLLGPAGTAFARNRALSPLVLSSDLYASPDPQRFVFAVAKGANFASTAPATVGFAAPGAGRAPMQPARLLKAGLPRGRGIYVVDTVFPVAGVYRSVVETRGERVPFAVQVKSVAEAPRPGAAAPRAASPTPTATLGVDPICTRVPPCPLHAVSLADVVGTGQPLAVMFATPALCQSQYCGPVLDQFLDVRARYEARVTFVHVEIYASNRGATLSPTVEAWGLPSEPWLYTVAGDGTIVGRLDGAIATPEITTLLDQLVAVA